MARGTVRDGVRIADLGLGAVVGCASLAFLCYMWLNPSGTPIFGVSPLTLPESMAILLLALSVVLLAQAWLAPRPVPAEGAGDTAGANDAADPPESAGMSAGRLVLLLVFCVAFIAALPWLGFLLSGGALVAATALLFGNRQVAVIVPMAIATPYLLSLFFEKAMVIYLPAGRLFQ